MQPLISYRAGPLTGKTRIPGDKSISHRAVMLGAVAVGETIIHGLLEGEDVLRTAAAMRALGAHVERRGGADGWRVLGVGVGGLAEPEAVLDFGNSGTSTRLLAGLLATHPLTAFVTGDASLVRRPMGRVMTPLERMGAQFICRSGGRLPMAVLGTDSAVPITYALPVASAQVKSAVLLAGLNTPGHTTVIEPQPTRDHSEHLLRHFGAELQIEDMAGVGQAITIIGQPELAGRVVRVPGDISSAAFPIVAALIVPGSDLILVDVGLNPRRTGLLDTLWEMGADIEVFNHRSEAGEPAADLRVRTSALRGIDVPPERAPRMIDEYPALAVAAACAAGTTRMLGVGELRVKESDRIAMMAAGLAACGAAVEAGPDTLTVHGTGAAPPGGVRVATSLDHRIAMSFLVLGTATAEPVAIDDAGPIETSFPGFVEVMNAAGGRIQTSHVETTK